MTTTRRPLNWILTVALSLPYLVAAMWFRGVGLTDNMYASVANPLVFIVVLPLGQLAVLFWKKPEPPMRHGVWVGVMSGVMGIGAYALWITIESIRVGSASAGTFALLMFPFMLLGEAVRSAFHAMFLGVATRAYVRRTRPQASVPVPPTSTAEPRIGQP